MRGNCLPPTGAYRAGGRALVPSVGRPPPRRRERSEAAARPGARVGAEAPFGVFTDAVRRCDGALLSAGCTGIMPMQALLEATHDGQVVICRVVREWYAVLRGELEASAGEHRVRLEVGSGKPAAAAGVPSRRGHVRPFGP